jgi:hypothetical protein
MIGVVTVTLRGKFCDGYSKDAIQTWQLLSIKLITNATAVPFQIDLLRCADHGSTSPLGHAAAYVTNLGR